MDEPRFEVRKVQMHDTGIGREAGYEDDAALIAAAEAERAALPPEVRRLMDRFDAEMDRALFGFSATLNGERIDPRRISPAE